LPFSIQRSTKNRKLSGLAGFLLLNKKQPKSHAHTQRQTKRREEVVKKHTVASQQRKKKELVYKIYSTLRLHFSKLFDLKLF